MFRFVLLNSTQEDANSFQKYYKKRLNDGLTLVKLDNFVIGCQLPKLYLKI